MATPSVEYQEAIYALLMGSDEVMALIFEVYDDTRVADADLSAGAPYGDQEGYVSFGPEMVVPDQADCIATDEITLQLDVWSIKPGATHCKQVCGAIRAVISSAQIDLPTFGHVSTELTLQQIMRDPDDGIMHGVLQFTAFVEEDDDNA